MSSLSVPKIEVVPKLEISAPVLLPNEHKVKTPHSHHLQRRNTVSHFGPTNGELDSGRTVKPKEEILHARKLLLKRIKHRQVKEVNLTDMGPFSSREFKKLVAAVRDQQKVKPLGRNDFQLRLYLYLVSSATHLISVIFCSQKPHISIEEPWSASKFSSSVVVRYPTIR